MQDGPFAVDASCDGARSVLTVHGEIDMATVDGLSDAIAAAADGTPEELWVDLSDVGFLDSTGLSALVRGHQALDGRLVVICPDGGARRAIEVAGLHQVMRVCRTTSDVR